MVSLPWEGIISSQHDLERDSFAVADSLLCSLEKGQLEILLVSLVDCLFFWLAGILFLWIEPFYHTRPILLHIRVSDYKSVYGPSSERNNQEILSNVGSCGSPWQQMAIKAHFGNISSHRPSSKSLLTINLLFEVLIGDER